MVEVAVTPSCSRNKEQEEEGKGGNFRRSRSVFVLLCLYMQKRPFYQDRLGTNKRSDNHSTQRAPTSIYLCRSGRRKGKGQGRAKGRPRQFRVVSTTLVQDEVGTDSAPSAVLHAGDTGDALS